MSEQRLRLSISFRQDYKHIYEHLLKQANKSDYICRILQKEYEREQKAQSLEDKLEELLSAIADGKNVNNQSAKNTMEEVEQQLEDEDIQLINELF